MLITLRSIALHILTKSHRGVTAKNKCKKYVDVLFYVIEFIIRQFVTSQKKRRRGSYTIDKYKCMTLK